MFAKSDKKLIKNYLGGDNNAFGEIVKRYKDYVYNLAYRMTDNPADAEDLTQEIFISLMEKIGSFKGNSKFSTWLYRLTTNQCLDWLRKRKPANRQIDDMDLKSNDDILASIEVKEQLKDVDEALSHLPEDFKIVVILRDIEGFSYDEIAGQLGISIGTVKSRISRGRANLMKLLTLEGTKQLAKASK